MADDRCSALRLSAAHLSAEEVLAVYRLRMRIRGVCQRELGHAVLQPRHAAIALEHDAFGVRSCEKFLSRVRVFIVVHCKRSNAIICATALLSLWLD